tara:strand:- start:920 stop:1159 length:240 start_codon:yes stop_codon:yes gene_type:complete
MASMDFTVIASSVILLLATVAIKVQPVEQFALLPFSCFNAELALASASHFETSMITIEFEYMEDLLEHGFLSKISNQIF